MWSKFVNVTLDLVGKVKIRPPVYPIPFGHFPQNNKLIGF